MYGRFTRTVVMALAIATVCLAQADCDTFNVYGQLGDRIGDAIDIASNGDLILVHGGVYSGSGNVNLSFQGKAIEIRSTSGAANTIIDCQVSSQTRAFTFNSGEGSGSRLIGFTIKRGNANYAPIHGGGGHLHFVITHDFWVRFRVLQGAYWWSYSSPQ